MNQIYKRSFLLSFVFFLFLLTSSKVFPEISQSKFKIDNPSFVLKEVPFSITISALTKDGTIDTSFNKNVSLSGIFKISKNNEIIKIDSTNLFSKGTITLSDIILPSIGKATISLKKDNQFSEKTIRVIPGYLSLLPPIFAILMALVFKQVLIALFGGIWLGAIFIYGYNPFIGFIRTLDTYLINSLADPSHAAIIIFSMTLGGMVGVISKSGGTQGIVKILARFANNRRGGQLATWAMGIFIFFDDYANTLIVGNTMRPFTDKLKISREKLSYIVDSTAAPVVSIAVISSWVGFQIGLIDQAFKVLNIGSDPYITFIQSIPYATYSVLSIVFIFLLSTTSRDQFTMLKAEKRALTTGKVLSDNAQPLADAKSLDIAAEAGTPLRWYNALIPIFAVIFVTLAGLYYNGLTSLGDKAGDIHLGEIIGAADSFHVLMWSSFTGAIIAIILAVSQKILTLSKALEAWLSGVKAMIIAMIILVLAWSIGDICSELKTADYVINLTKDFLSPHLLPLITFIVAAFIGFSTGTSWATMAILMPIVIPTAVKLTTGADVDPAVANSIMLASIASVLSGSVFGDHCSPISDTTIMSSMASAADHIDHVKTQLPYAILVALVGCFIGYLPAGYGFNVWLSLLIGTLLLLVSLYVFGKKVE